MTIVVDGREYDPAANAWKVFGTFQVPPPTEQRTPVSAPADFTLTDDDYNVVITGSVGGILKAVP